jgi:molybdopterin converting factor small subunit
VAVVYIPQMPRAFEAPGATVREVIENLEAQSPGMREKLLDQDRLRPNIRVAIDGEIAPLGLLERVGPDSEIHFVAAISGGARPQRR